MPFPERLHLVLAEVHQQLASGMDLSVVEGMPEEMFLSEIRTASLTLLRNWRVDAISEEDRVAISHAIAVAVQARIQRLFRGQAVPDAPGEDEQVLELAWTALQQAEQSPRSPVLTGS